MNFITKTGFILLVLLSLLFYAPLERGWCMTPAETSQTITIQISQWNDLKANFQTLNQELIACKSELQRIKKPSSELVTQLAQAEKMLKQLQEDLQKQSNELTQLYKQVDESKTLLQTLKDKINKERKIHKRQIWQNRFWCLLIGAGIGFACK